MTTPNPTPVEHRPDAMLAAALLAARAGKEVLAETIASLPAPIYVTDAEGWITEYNDACIDFAGRTPVPGKDRWCVSWRLFEESGTPLPHDQCPMAVAVREQRPVRGAVAIAERPDGARVTFMPFPTPLLDKKGAMTGAVNMLIDVTEARRADALAEDAARCRRLAAGVGDQRTVEALHQFARECDEQARRLRG